MRTLLRSLSFGLGTAIGLAALAQPLPPYTVIVAGYVAGCTPNSSVNITTVQNTQPAIDIDVPLDSNCGFSIDLLMDSYQGWFVITTPCLGAIQSVTGTYTVNALDSTVVFVTINCGSATTDCLGVVGGSALPGTACTNFLGVVGTWTTNCICDTDTTSGTLDCMGVPGGSDLPGTPCGFPNGISGIWSADCICDPDTTNGGADCLGILNGPDLPGAPCQSPFTGENGYWSADCICIPDSTTLDCQAGFWVFQAYAIDSLNPNGSATPIPNELWIWNTSIGNGPMQYFWNFGDGSSSTEEFPTHFYPNGGPYMLCLTITDATCTSTSCDSISIDGDGMYTGMILEQNYARAGFTINVLQALPTGMGDQPSLANAALWPNPVAEELNLSFNTTVRGSVPMSIIDLNGHVVNTTNVSITNGTNRVGVPVNDLAPGMYLVRFGTGSIAVALRFVKH
ncbi:MAG: T9SS type A sorting domain-containing protein [Flavobacteriales bacterium]|nr:T9SS type A sorting domain-containing protein [Flavobacteriales bacterium]